MAMTYYEEHSFSSSQADDMDERRSTISVSPIASADEKPFSFFGLLCYADKIDWFLMALGTIGSIIHGIAFPIGYLLLGKALDAFGTNINDQEGMVHALYKLGHFVASFSTFFAGIIIAFISCWEVAMLSFLVIPLILIIGAAYTKKMNGISRSRNAIVSEAISVVEQTLSHIKTVFSFVGENWAMKSFVQCTENQFKLSKKEAIIKGIGLGLFQAVTFCSWALMVWIGAVAVTKKTATGGGTIAAIMSILFGAM